MKERSYLNKSILLAGQSDEKRFIRTFKVVKKIEEGASVICYEAYHGNSGRGILKEFYPWDAYSLERAPDGQLVHTDGFGAAKEQFLKAQEEYLGPYQMLLLAKQTGKDPDLSTFIPAFEIYHGCDKNGNIVGSSYIWMPEPKLETFEELCDKIRKNPKKEPEHNLVLILTAIESLSKCICALHHAEMIHTDIKPSNFGFVNRRDETLTQALSMFDMDSIRSVYQVSEKIVGTKGYMEPEAGYLRANNQTDIYSIGATLFYAVAATEEVKAAGYLYRDIFYGELKNIVDQSPLIQASESNSHPRLRNSLTVILQKCLAKRADRYTNCEELLEDLETALYYALPSELAKKKRLGEQWILKDVEKSFDVNAEKNSTLAIQYHLYQNPMYRWGTDDWIHVMIIGFGNYGQKFLDSCLQAGQMPGKKLDVTVVSDDKTDKELYLQDKPELSRFFNMDHAADADIESYGNISFENVTLKSSEEENKKILQDLLCDWQEREGKALPQYIFIALGEDSLNQNAANACQEAIEVLEFRCCVNVAVEKKGSVKCKPPIVPVYVCETMENSPLHTEIERMAWNAHLVWEKNLNVDYRAIRANFRKPYYHNACVSNVLSLKYKLYSIGIDLDECGFDQAASLFTDYSLGTNPKDEALKNELICAEHKRWVVEKLCAGWKQISDLEECLGGITKDERNKRHVCLVRSRADQKLAKEFQKNGSFKKLDKNFVKKLDELDKLSVSLHQLYAKRARILKKQNLLNGYNIAEIRRLIQTDKKAVAAFGEWFSCLKDIWNQDHAKVRLYQGLKSAFLLSIEKLPLENRRAVKEQVKAFEALFYPVRASMEYRDYKQNDVAFIDNIPFMLTYTDSIYLAVPYAIGDNTELFSNIAASLVVNPERILYLCYLENRQDIRTIADSLPYISAFMEKKKLRAAVEFIISYSQATSPHSNDEVEREFKLHSNGKVRRIKFLYTPSIEELPGVLAEYLAQRKRGKRIFALEKNHTKLSGVLLGAGIASYEFDLDKMKFHSFTGCDALSYINKKPHISVSDMVKIRSSSGESSRQPEFFSDYQKLWEKYHTNTSIWKQLCGKLRNFARNADKLASFKKNRNPSGTPEERRYILPFACYQAVFDIVTSLRNQNIVGPDSRINAYTTDSCEVVLADPYGYKSVYDDLFSKVYALMDHESIQVDSVTDMNSVRIVFDNLIVQDMPLDAGKEDELVKLLRYFEEMGYIINLQVNNNKASFTYATRQIKELMTVEGKMLEVYIYHKIKDFGRFDDVVSSFEIDWEDTGVKSECDCIVTKGFQSLFVECKARSKLCQDFYYKLRVLTEQFGINATAVLVADTEERSYYDSAKTNRMQRRRGNMMNMVTVWKRDEIENIGDTLLKIMDGTYESEE